MQWAELFKLTIYHGYIFQLLLAELLFYEMLQKRDHFALRAVVGTLFYVLASIVLTNLVRMYVSGLNSVIIFLLSLLLLLFCFSNHIRDILFYCVGALLTQNLSHNIEYLIYQPVREREPIGYFGWFLISVAVMAVVYFAVYMIFIRRLKTRYWSELSSRYAFPLSIAVTLFVYAMQYLFEYYEIDDLWIIRPPMILCCIFGLCVQFELVALNNEQQQRQMLERMIQQERQQYELTKNSMDLINLKAHDLKYQITRMKEMGDRDEEGLQEVEQAVDQYEVSCNSGNPTLDVIVTEKQLLCQKSGITFSVIADGKALDFMQDSDLYSLLGNALDNAIECENKVAEPDKRCISMNVFRKGNLVSIKIENYCPDALAPKDDHFETTKEDPNNHGFGLSSMRYITQKYNGSFQICVRNDLFTVALLFQSSDRKEEVV